MAKQDYNRDPLILLAEDDENDITLFRRALVKANIRNPVEIVRDGEEAIAYLKGEGKFSDRVKYPLPALMLLDLKMPRIDGFQVLDWIRRQSELKALRVVVLTVSRDIYDVTRAYRFGANSFLVKSLDSQTFTQLVESIHQYWLSAGLAPRVSRPGEPAADQDGPSLSA
jgi:CheY-like chemotaxis protein